MATRIFARSLIATVNELANAAILPHLRVRRPVNIRKQTYTMYRTSKLPNPSQWGRQFPTCNGLQQSPIPLDRDSAQTQWSGPFGDSPVDIEFLDYDQRADGNFTNTGHTVQLTLFYNDTSRTPRTVVTIDEGSTTSVNTYYFRSLHFHWPSEHYIDDDQYLLELHMVHTTNDGRILVLGYLYRECRRARSGMQVIASAVRRLTNLGSSVGISQFAPQRLMPDDSGPCGYFRYNGSLTTPLCSEGVTWLVRYETLCVERWEMEAFRTVRNEEGKPMSGNARPLQPVNDRPVFFHECWFPQWSRWWWFRWW